MFLTVPFLYSLIKPWWLALLKQILPKMLLLFGKLYFVHVSWTMCLNITIHDIASTMKHRKTVLQVLSQRSSFCVLIVSFQIRHNVIWMLWGFFKQHINLSKYAVSSATSTDYNRLFWIEILRIGNACLLEMQTPHFLIKQTISSFSVAFALQLWRPTSTHPWQAWCCWIAGQFRVFCFLHGFSWRQNTYPEN